MISSIISWVRTRPESEWIPITWEEEDYVGLQVTILDFLLLKIFQFLVEDIVMLIKFPDKIG